MRISTQRQSALNQRCDPAEHGAKRDGVGRKPMHEAALCLSVHFIILIVPVKFCKSKTLAPCLWAAFRPTRVAERLS